MTSHYESKADSVLGREIAGWLVGGQGIYLHFMTAGRLLASHGGIWDVMNSE